MSGEHWRQQYEQVWALTEQDIKMYELAERYHSETEAYDRTVCSGPIVDGAIMPIGSREMSLVNRNAIKVRERILFEAEQQGINRRDMARAIRRYGEHA